LTRHRLFIALGCYAALGLAAGLTLSGDARLMVWILLGGLAAKSWIAWKKEGLG
jgi:hypothetical protein